MLVPIFSPPFHVQAGELDSMASHYKTALTQLEVTWQSGDVSVLSDIAKQYERVARVL